MDILFLVIGITLITIGLYLIYTRGSDKRIGKKLYNSITNYENIKNTNIIFLVDEFWSGPLNKFTNFIIDIDDGQIFMERIHEINCSGSTKPLSIIINTFGGSISSSDMILEVILNSEYDVNIYVPTFALSAGTMIALGGTNLYMNKDSILGPVDPQLTYNIDDKGEDDTSSICLLQLLENKEDLDDNLHLKALESRFLHEDNIKNLKKIIKKRNLQLTKSQKKRFVNELGSGKYPHHKPFSIGKIKQLNIPVQSPVPQWINSLFSEFVQFRRLFN